MTAAALVLAAGASVRMGRPKALLQVSGRPAVDVVCEALRDAGCEPVIVVIGRHASEIREGAGLSECTVVEHAAWADGRTASIQAGLAARPPSDDPVVLALVDMPLVKTSSIVALLTGWRITEPRPDVVVPRHAGRGGHPIVLAPGVLDAIAALGPDEPLRDLLRTCRRLDVDVSDPGVLIDLDTPEDLLHLPPA